MSERYTLKNFDIEALKRMEATVILKPANITIHDTTRVDSIVKIEGGRGVYLGPGVHISSFVHLNIGGGKLTVDENVAITSGVEILTGTNTADGRSMSSAAPPEEQVVERWETHIEHRAFLGMGCRILQGCKYIGRYAIVAAGSEVNHDVPPYAIVLGSPARIIGDRRNRPGWHWGDGDEAPLNIPAEREQAIANAIKEKYGFDITSNYASDFLRFITAIVDKLP